MRVRDFWWCGVLIWFGAPGWAGFGKFPDKAFSKEAVGTTGANFLTVPLGARAMAMGGAFSAIADDVTAIAWNPAGLGQLLSQEISASHNLLLESQFSDFLAYGLPLAPGRAVAVSLLYASQDSIQALDELGQDAGSFKPSDTAVTAAYGHKFERFYAGGAVKYIRSEIESASGSAFAMDFGVLIPDLQEEKLTLSAVIQNLGTEMKLENEADPLPFTARLGGFLKATRATNASVETVLPVDNAPYFAFGLERFFETGGNATLALRGGVNTRTKDAGGLRMLTAGGGMAWRNATLDYAWMAQGDLGASHRISFGLRFSPISNR